MRKGRRLDPSQDGLAGDLGFTPDRFDGWLWRVGKTIYISFIVSKEEGQGHLSELFNAIWRKGFTVKVPTPFARMEAILRNKGFVRTVEHSEQMGGDVEVWLKRTGGAA